MYAHDILNQISYRYMEILLFTKFQTCIETEFNYVRGSGKGNKINMVIYHFMKKK